MTHNAKRADLATALTAAVCVTVCAVGLAFGADELKVIQQPTFWIVGQWARIMVQTPADCGKLAVTHPQRLVLLDRWPHRAGDKVQRFYFRAKAPFKSGDMVFKSAKHTLALPVSVLSWQEVLTEKFEREIAPGWSWTGTLKLPRLFPIDGQDESKSGLSHMTKEELEGERAGFSRHLKGRANEQIARAEDIEKIFNSLPASCIPRAVYVNNPIYQSFKNKVKGCPVCGAKIFEGRHAFYPWVLDMENRPFKIQCPECERWFPSNDFSAGDMTSGEYPDDGWGYFDDQGRPYSFIGYYTEWNYNGKIRGAPWEFSTYYLASGDRRWGRAAAAMLFRIAEQYLNLSLNINQRNRFTRDRSWQGRFPKDSPPPSHSSWFAPGFYTDAVWSIRRADQYAVSFERIWDYFDEEDPVLLSFLQEHHHPEMKSMLDVRGFIETGYFRTVAQAFWTTASAATAPRNIRWRSKLPAS